MEFYVINNCQAGSGTSRSLPVITPLPRMGRTFLNRLPFLMLSLLLLAALGEGCSTIRADKQPSGVQASLGHVERSFAGALQSLKKGNEREAQTLLEEVIAGKPMPGMTDEAFFRLAVLHLGDEDGDGDAQARALMARLQKEYPDSNWSRQATPLLAHLDEMDDLRKAQEVLNARWVQSQSLLRESRHEAKNLKERNLSLVRDNKELSERNHSVVRDNKELQKRLDSLKDLDLEIDQKNRR
jgi:DNA repair exonuclease SbcCD ATPase subunit